MPVVEHSHLFRRSGLLGTVTDVSVTGAEATVADVVASGVFAEIERLQAVFNTFDPASEMSRWRRGETTPGPELTEVIATAAAWQRRTGGAFDPAIGGLQALWERARSNGELPTAAEISHALSVKQRSPIRSWNLNAIAKGWIVDRAARNVIGSKTVPGLVVNSGGDLISLGEAPTVVGIENPRRPYDNVTPLTRVAVKDAALATSGNTRRGWRIAGEWYGHVIDPRTGWPADHVESASVIASDAATADAVATSMTVLPVAEGLALADELGVACLLIDATNHAHRNDLWRYTEVGVPALPELIPSSAKGSTHTVTKGTNLEPSYAI